MSKRKPPAEKEVARIGEAQGRWIARRPPVQVSFEQNGSGFGVVSPHDDESGFTMRVGDALGTRSAEFMSTAITALEAGSRPRGQEQRLENGAVGTNSGLAVVKAIRPKDELEAALAIQMAQNHALSTELMSRAKTCDSVDHLQIYANLAVKLQRTFTGQIEALARMRGKGQQTVRVEHVTVEAGAQAIVGDVHHHSRVQPHVGTDQPFPGVIQVQAALPCPDPVGAGVPLPVDDQRSVPNARRRKHRRTAREPERPEARALQP